MAYKMSELDRDKIKIVENGITTGQPQIYACDILSNAPILVLNAAVSIFSLGLTTSAITLRRKGNLIIFCMAI